MVIKVILGLLFVMTLYFAFVFFQDYSKTAKEGRLENGSVITFGIIGFVANFFDTLGLGSFAPITAVFRFFKLTEDRTIPGTLNVACTIPIVLEAFIFMTVIKVDTVTLIAMLVSATVGAYFGAGFVSKLPEKKVQMGMGIALFLVAFLMLAGQLKILPVGGAEIGLTGGKLIVGVVGNFILGALMCIGIGLYAPCMALVFALGMSPKVAFPIMMGSCAFLMPVASAKFVKEGAYNRKASLPITLFGSIGVLIAGYIVKELPLKILTWLVILVILYTAIVMLKSSMKHTDEPKNLNV